MLSPLKASIKGMARSLFLGLILSTITISLVVVGGKSYANINESSSISDCKTNGYAKMLRSGDIDPAKVTQAQVIENCETLKNRIEGLLDSYGATDREFPIYITGHLSTFCGEHSVGCVNNLYRLHDNIPAVMSISYTVDYTSGLEHTVAHEYVHTLTSSEETAWLYENSHRFPQGVDPLEAVADCGISHFTKKDFMGGSYMDTCTPDHTAISVAIINDTLVK